jgi:hypothetical protein
MHSGAVSSDCEDLDKKGASQEIKKPLPEFTERDARTPGSGQSEEDTLGPIFEAG